jgi:hypothetical protein
MVIAAVAVVVDGAGQTSRGEQVQLVDARLARGLPPP